LKIIYNVVALNSIIDGHHHVASVPPPPLRSLPPPKDSNVHWARKLVGFAALACHLPCHLDVLAWSADIWPPVLVTVKDDPPGKKLL
jgi:hypothetical protein